MLNKDWYGERAKEVEVQKQYSVVDYGCEGRGIVTSYSLFDGIQLTFLDFDTSEVFLSQKYNSDIISINYCKIGRYECEFPNHTVTYLPDGHFSVNGTKYLPASFSFPLKRYSGLSLVIDKQSLSKSMYEIMDKIPINLEKIGSSLDLEHGWYTSKTPAKLDHIFSEIYQAKELESSGYFKIKAVEILYHIDQLTKNKGCDFKYFEKGQIQATKRIHEYLIQHLEERLSLEELAEEEHINLSLFHKIFAQIYGDTPYAYLKKYKMNLAAQMLQENNRKISDIALELGYSNPSKFAKAFYSVYGKLPKDFRKDQ